MKKRHIGFILLLGVILIAGGYQFYQSQQKPEIKINGFVGGEKINLLKDEEFIDYIKKEHNLTIDYQKDGSIDMVSRKPNKEDYIFPSSQIAADLFKKNGYKSSKQEIIFNTPIVIYSWKNVVKTLDEQGITYIKNGVHYVKMDELSKVIAEGKTWQQLKQPDLSGKVLVSTTNPEESNSGNLFLGLIANSLNNNETLNPTSLAKIEPQIKKIYQSMGYMNSSSDDMFKQYMSQGMGAFPLVAGYESQILEFANINKGMYDRVKDDIIILYPEPTVWSSHVFISLNKNTDKVADILLEKEVQSIAWKKHGFRTPDADVTKDSKVKGIAPSVTKIMPTPDSETMLKLIDIVKNK